MNSIEVLTTGSNQAEILVGQNMVDLPGGGLFRVVLTWYFLAPNFPVCIYEEVEV